MAQADDLPVGPPVEPAPPVRPASGRRYTGRFVTAQPVDPDGDVAALYDASHGSAEVERLWTYMAYGPFGDQDAMCAWLRTCQSSTDPLFLTVHADGRPAGMASFMNIVPSMRRLELGQRPSSGVTPRTSDARAACGFAVPYPNDLGRTGRGVVFGKLGQHDRAGRDFDDLTPSASPRSHSPGSATSSRRLILYRYLKLHGQAPVRLVRYPDERHGNRRAASRFDYNVRMLRWFEHYLKGPGGAMPPYAVDYQAALK